jgi:hypothetical protein
MLISTSVPHITIAKCLALNHKIRTLFSAPIWITHHLHVELELTLQWKVKLEVMQNKLLKGMFGTTADERRSLPDGDTSQRSPFN